MRRQGRLTRPAEFRRAYSSGKALVHPLVVLHALAHGEGPSRAGFTVGRGYGSAVERNRARRRLRAAYRATAADVKDGFDLVFVARSAMRESSFPALCEAFRQVLARAGAMGEGGGERRC